jgi:dethiobiotin synthetase
MTQNLFITGTDTNVGKTVVSALLTAVLDGVYWKPIQTGSREGTDRGAVKRWAEVPEERTLPECYCFEPPVSPHLAAEMSGGRIDLASICPPKGTLHGPLIVEGAGGVLVPLNEKELMIDLMRHLGFPVVVATRTTLGTINHTLLTLSVLRGAGVELLGVVMVGEENPDNLRAIERFGGAKVIGRVPPLAVINRASLLKAFQRNFDRKKFE